MADSIDLTTVPQDELRTVALLAEACLRIHAAEAYGFIEWPGEDEGLIDVARCEEALALARQRGIVYTDDDVDAVLVAMVRELASGVPDA